MGKRETIPKVCILDSFGIFLIYSSFNIAVQSFLYPEMFCHLVHSLCTSAAPVQTAQRKQKCRGSTGQLVPPAGLCLLM